MWGGDVDDVDGGVGDEIMVGTVWDGTGGSLNFLKEFGGAIEGGGGCCGVDGVFDVGYLAGCWVGEDIEGKCWREKKT